MLPGRLILLNAGPSLSGCPLPPDWLGAQLTRNFSDSSLINAPIDAER